MASNDALAGANEALAKLQEDDAKVFNSFASLATKGDVADLNRSVAANTTRVVALENLTTTNDSGSSRMPASPWRRRIVVELYRIPATFPGHV
ncbi:hypothetical protein E2562_024572 [Oryza meyeriana var. granulata]|uniref:Uncharacterized protein n=1 Tax=Oryza meyeriana var. granulata TaxID=110450 RepID=A0A6G1CSD7_9ORYZ|nr:hypothetical protein E2562_024572 [Oryza meyeriana var. granulata]